MVNWFKTFLSDAKTSVLDDPEISLFVRDSALPGQNVSDPLDSGKNISGNFFSLSLDEFVRFSIVFIHSDQMQSFLHLRR